MLYHFGRFEGLYVGLKPQGAQVLLGAAAGHEANVVDGDGVVAHEADLGAEPANGNFRDAEPALAVGHATCDDLVCVKGQDADGGKFNAHARGGIFYSAEDHADFGALSHGASAFWPLTTGPLCCQESRKQDP